MLVVGWCQWIWASADGLDLCIDGKLGGGKEMRKLIAVLVIIAMAVVGMAGAA